MKLLSNHRGIAYLLVVSLVTLMMSIVVGLKMYSSFHRQMTLNAKARLQASYLAKSGFQFTKLLLLYDKKIQEQVKKMGASASTLNAVGYQPLYELFPLSSELLRGFLGGVSVPPADIPENLPEEKVSEEEGEGFAELNQAAGLLQQEKVKEFLDFDGDFETEVSEEASKFSLNTISKLSATSSTYDLYKKILFTIMRRKEFKNFFEYQDRDAENLTHAIFDFIDTNASVNEFDQIERGEESSLYRDIDYEIKNAKMLTLSELRLVAGMSDDIYAALEPYLTVYHTSDRMNVCLAEEAILDALLLHFTTESGCTDPLDSDDEKTLKELREAVLSGCPDPVAMANALNVALGLTSAEDMTEDVSQKKSLAKISGCNIHFGDLITDENNIFTIKAKGLVDEVNTTMTIVLDTSSSQPVSWKILYYQVN